MTTCYMNPLIQTYHTNLRVNCFGLCKHVINQGAEIYIFRYILLLIVLLDLQNKRHKK